MRLSTFALWLKYINREPRAIIMIGGLLIFSMVGWPFGLMFAAVLGRGLPFVLDGETVQAKIIGKEQACAPTARPLLASALFATFGNRKQQGPRYLVRYEFADANGKTHSGQASVSLSDWNALDPGDSIAVRYVRSAPARNQLESQGVDFCGMVPFAVLAPVIAFALIRHGSRGIRWIHRQIDLIRHGDAVPGRFLRAVVEARGTGKRREVVIVLEYQYLTPALMTGTIELCGRLRENWKTGGDIVVFINPGNPADHAPDIFDARPDVRERLFGIICLSVR